MHRVAPLVAAVFLTLVLAAAWSGAQELPKPSASIETIPVTEVDSLVWERFQLLSRLAAAQQDLLRLQNEKTLAEEYAKLDATFHAHYKISVNQVERKGDLWILRQPVAPTVPK